MLNEFQKAHRDMIVNSKKFKLFLKDGKRKVSKNGKENKTGNITFIWIADSAFKKYRKVMLSKTEVISYFIKDAVNQRWRI